MYGFFPVNEIFTFRLKQLP